MSCSTSDTSLHNLCIMSLVLAILIHYKESVFHFLLQLWLFPFLFFPNTYAKHMWLCLKQPGVVACQQLYCASWCNLHAATLSCLRRKQMSWPIQGFWMTFKICIPFLFPPEAKKFQLDMRSWGFTYLFRGLSREKTHFKERAFQKPEWRSLNESLKYILQFKL